MKYNNPNITKSNIYSRNETEDIDSRELTLSISKFLPIYKIIAVTFILIPEFIAERIYEIVLLHEEVILPSQANAWREDANLRISLMSFKELRLYAMKLNLKEYSREGKTQLRQRIILKEISNRKRLLDVTDNTLC